MRVAAADSTGGRTRNTRQETNEGETHPPDDTQHTPTGVHQERARAEYNNSDSRRRTKSERRRRAKTATAGSAPGASAGGGRQRRRRGKEARMLAVQA